MTNIVDDLLYTEDDEWIRVEDGEATVGITDYAQDSLSDIVYLELPDEGERYEKGATFGVIESVKAAADLYMPAGGEVVAVNEALLDEPEVVNNDPFGQGWMLRIKVDDQGDLEDLMDADAYRQYCEERS
jgi:glycine cleavage system H protein